MTVQLPTEKTAPSLAPERAKVLLYGPAKIGKSTLASKLDPEHTLFLACEPGLGAIEAYELPIATWQEFRETGAELAKGEHPYRILVVDTVDELIRMCADDVLGKLGASHASDLGYGKGWAAIADEFRLRIARLANLGLGVWFISHSKEVEIKTAVGSITKSVPDIGGQARSFLIGFCDLILFATSQVSSDGEHRILRTSASENWEAGGRVPLADPLPLDAAALRADLERACGMLTPKPPEPEAKTQKKAPKGEKAAEQLVVTA